MIARGDIVTWWNGLRSFTGVAEEIEDELIKVAWHDRFTSWENADNLTHGEKPIIRDTYFNWLR